jgi:hypothetical protein
VATRAPQQKCIFQPHSKKTAALESINEKEPTSGFIDFEGFENLNVILFITSNCYSDLLQRLKGNLFDFFVAF